MFLGNIRFCVCVCVCTFVIQNRLAELQNTIKKFNLVAGFIAGSQRLLVLKTFRRNFIMLFRQ
jgi:hypothetical protein